MGTWFGVPVFRRLVFLMFLFVFLKRNARYFKITTEEIVLSCS